MLCPSCKKENPQHPKICALCGYDPAITYEPATSKAAKAARLSFILAILSFFTFLITAIPAIIFAILALRRIRRSIDRLKGRRLALASIVISLCAVPIVPTVLYALWSPDAPPIPNDYTIADLRSAPADCNGSFDVLKKLSPKNTQVDVANAINMSAEEVEVLNEITFAMQEDTEFEAVAQMYEKEEFLEGLWRKNEGARTTIAKLDQFVEIADLDDPANPSPTIWQLMRLSDLTQAHIHLRILKNDSRIPVAELIELDSVTRKLAVNSRSLVTKLICLAELSGNITSANSILNSPDVSEETLDALATHFVRLSDEITSLRNPIIHEYLWFKRDISDMFGRDGFWKSLTFKRNSTLRVFHNFTGRLLAMDNGDAADSNVELEVWPSAYRGLGQDKFQIRERLPFIYRCYNPNGWRALMWMSLRYDKHFAKQTGTHIRDDLLQIVLDARLGKSANMKARAYGNEYVIDAGMKKIFSPGPDGEAGTEDDIFLRINPAVLGWDK